MLRELRRAEETLLEECRRTTNRLREQWHRLYPQMLQLRSAADEAWLWDLMARVPTPAHATAVTADQVQQVLKAHRMRRVKADEGLVRLQAQALLAAPGSWKRHRSTVHFCCRVCACWLSNCGGVPSRARHG
jgi:hypothetical protein